jgi:hypothetical protein
MSSVGMALGYVSFGLLFALAGYPIFRILLPIYAGLVGYALGVNLIPPEYQTITAIVALGLAVLFGSLAYLYWSLLMGVAGALLGYGLVSGLVSALGLESLVVYLMSGLFGALVGFLALSAAKDFMVMVASALNGALMVGWGAQWLWDPTSKAWGGVAAMSFLVVAGLGLWAQIKWFGEEMKYTESRAKPASVNPS